MLERVAQAGLRSQSRSGVVEVKPGVGWDSVEDAARQRVLDLMDPVFHAEATAAAAGAVP